MKFSAEQIRRFSVLGIVGMAAFYVLFLLGVVWGVINPRDPLLMKGVNSLNLVAAAGVALVVSLRKFPDAWEAESAATLPGTVRVARYCQRAIFVSIPLSLILALAIVWGAVSEQQLVAKTVLTMVVLVLVALGLDAALMKYEGARQGTAFAPSTPAESRARTKTLIGVALGLLVAFSAAATLSDQQRHAPRPMPRGAPGVHPRAPQPGAPVAPGAKKPLGG